MFDIKQKDNLKHFGFFHKMMFLTNIRPDAQLKKLIEIGLPLLNK
jgi:hypothetical protein